MPVLRLNGTGFRTRSDNRFVKFPIPDPLEEYLYLMEAYLFLFIDFRIPK